MVDKREWSAQELKDFVAEIATLHDEGYLPFAIHLPGGNEDALIEIFKRIKPGDYVFSTHRNWYHSLLHGVPRDVVKQHIFFNSTFFVKFLKDVVKRL